MNVIKFCNIGGITLRLNCNHCGVIKSGCHRQPINVPTAGAWVFLIRNDTKVRKTLFEIKPLFKTLFQSKTLSQMSNLTVINNGTKVQKRCLT
jgi:hypothetical protein